MDGKNFADYVAESFANARRKNYPRCKTLEQLAIDEMKLALGLATNEELDYAKLTPRQRRELLTLGAIANGHDSPAR